MERRKMRKEKSRRARELAKNKARYRRISKDKNLSPFPHPLGCYGIR